jgi:hypothetical protein
MGIKYLGYRLIYCPKCNEELLDMGYDGVAKKYEKQCIPCDLFFSRNKGYGHKWKMGSFMDLY